MTILGPGLPGLVVVVVVVQHGVGTHTTAFDSVRNERSAFANKRRRTHQDVNTNAGECRVRSFLMQLCFFFCF